MAILDYTTPTSIRAIIGVSDDEISDATIEDVVYSVMLNEALIDLSPTLVADYTTVKAILTPSADQTRFLNLVNTWCAYQVASQLMTSLELFAPKEIKSEKDAFTRIDDPYKDIEANIIQILSTLGTRILKLYAVLFPSQSTPTSTAIVSALAVGLPIDPVTGT